MFNKSFKEFLLIIVGALFLSIGVASFAAYPEIPRISPEELKELMANKVDVIILDAQLKSVYEQGHIKGAKSFPWRSGLADEDLKDIPKDKLIIIYCDCGPGEADSADLANQLLGLGFENVKVLKDPSIRGWKKSSYPTE